MKIYKKPIAAIALIVVLVAVSIYGIQLGWHKKISSFFEPVLSGGRDSFNVPSPDMSSKPQPAEKESRGSDAASAAIISGCIAFVLLLIGWAIVDRTKSLEQRLQDLQKDMDTKIRDISEREQGRVTEFVKQKTERVDALDSQLKRLERDYPWILGLRDSGLVPNIPSAYMVMVAARVLIHRDQVSLAHQYVYSWVIPKNDEIQQRLGGTRDQLLLLANFCEVCLLDPHLSLLLLQTTTENSDIGDAILPDYLRRLLIADRLNMAETVAADLGTMEYEPLLSNWNKFIAKLLRRAPKSARHLLLNQKEFALRRHLSLALYAATTGNSLSEKLHLSAAEKLAADLEQVECLQWASVERHILAGRYVRAKEIWDSFSHSTVPDQYMWLTKLSALALSRPFEGNESRTNTNGKECVMIDLKVLGKPPSESEGDLPNLALSKEGRVQNK